MSPHRMSDTLTSSARTGLIWRLSSGSARSRSRWGRSLPRPATCRGCASPAASSWRACGSTRPHGCSGAGRESRIGSVASPSPGRLRLGLAIHPAPSPRSVGGPGRVPARALRAIRSTRSRGVRALWRRHALVPSRALGGGAAAALDRHARARASSPARAGTPGAAAWAHLAAALAWHPGAAASGLKSGLLRPVRPAS